MFCCLRVFFAKTWQQYGLSHILKLNIDLIYYVFNKIVDVSFRKHVTTNLVIKVFFIYQER